MQIKLHKLAKTTPAIRKYIWNEVHINKRTRKELAKELNLNEFTVKKWAKKDRINEEDFHDKSHAKHNLNLLLNPKEIEIIIFCRENIGLSILDICEVLKNLYGKENEDNGRKIKYSKNSIYACIKRHDLKTPVEAAKLEGKIDKNKNKFDEVNEPGFVHVDFKYLPRIKEPNPEYKEGGQEKKYKNPRSYMFSAIDRYSRYVYTEILTDKSIPKVVEFLKNVIKDFEEKTCNENTNKSCKIYTILTDNGSEFTDRFTLQSKIKKQLGVGKNKPSGTHLFDVECKKYDIEHRLIKPFTPKTNGMIERFNGRIAKALKERKLFKGQFKTQKEMFDFVLNTCNKYNETKLQCLKYKSPMDMLEEFVGKSDNQMGCNTQRRG